MAVSNSGSNTLNFDDVVGVILSEEMWIKSTVETSGNALTMESGGRQNERGRSPRNHGKSEKGRSKSGSRKIECWICGKKGHLKKDWRDPKKKGDSQQETTQEANVAGDVLQDALILALYNCYEEKFLWLGVPQQTALTPEINLSQYAIEIKCLTLKDKTSYLIPDGWSRSPLSFPIFSLNWYNTSSTTSKQYKHTIYHGFRSILAYIINNVKAFDTFQWIQYSIKYT